MRKIIERVAEIASSYVNSLISPLASPIVADITLEKRDFCGKGEGEEKVCGVRKIGRREAVISGAAFAMGLRSAYSYTDAHKGGVSFSTFPHHEPHQISLQRRRWG